MIFTITVTVRPIFKPTRTACIIMSAMFATFPGFPVRFSNCLQVRGFTSLQFQTTTRRKNLSSPNFKKIFRRSKKASKIKASGAKKNFLPGRFQNRIRTRSGKKTTVTGGDSSHTGTHARTYARIRTCTRALASAYACAYTPTHMPAHAGVPAHACPHTPAPAHMGAHLHAHAYAPMGAHTRTRTQERNVSGTDHAKTQERTRTDGNRPGSKQSRAGTDRRIIDQERNGHGDRSAGRYRQGTPTPTRTDERTPHAYTHACARVGLDSRNAGSP